MIAIDTEVESTGHAPTLRQSYRVLREAAAARPVHGLTDDEVRFLLGRIIERNHERVLQMALADGVLIATWRCHGTDESHKDGWRYFELRRRP